MADKSLCRLCSENMDLVWVFDPKIVENLKEMIQLMCGVEIAKTDSVSQMVCSTCCQVTIKMYQFRTKSIKNDKDLKARCAGYNISQLTNPTPQPQTPQKANSAPVTPAPVTPVPVIVKPVTIKSITTSSPPPPAVVPIKYKNAHPSIKELVLKYPGLKVPPDCLKSHVGAYITLLTDEVDEWYIEKNYTENQIIQFKKEAAEIARTLEKNTEEEISSKKRKKEEATLRPSSAEEPKPRPTSPTNSSKRIRLSSESSTDRPLRGKLRDKSDSDASSVASFSSVASVPDKSVKNEKFGQVRNVIRTRSSDASAKVSLPVQTKTDQSEKKSLLNDLLVSDDKKIKILEEITLKSLLSSSKFKSSVDNEVIEIDDPPSPTSSSSEALGSRGKQNIFKQMKRGAKIPLPEDDAELYTSRPFIQDPSSSKTPGSGYKGSENSSDSDPIVVDVDSRSSSASSKYNENDKTSFAEALELAPRTSNMPDLSLVSLANKSYTLHTCKVCDSQHTSLKDLKHHMRRTHTKCPFCSKRFKTLALRDEHVRNTCSINKSPVRLKKMRLQLVRIDENEEIRKKYPEAFENDVEAEESSEEVIDVETVTDNASKEDAVVCDPATADAINELERFLNYAEVIPANGSPPDQLAAPPVGESTANTSTAGEEASTSTSSEIEGAVETANKTDVICISDDESEPVKPTKQPSAEQKISVVNSEILAHINIHDNDVNVLKQILGQSKLKWLLRQQTNISSLPQNPITNGSSSRVKIFKNLRRYLQEYKIPIQVSHGENLIVEYKKTKPVKVSKTLSLWHNMKPTELKTSAPPAPQVTTASTPTYTILNGQIGTGLTTSNAFATLKSVNTVGANVVVTSSAVATMKLATTSAVATLKPATTSAVAAIRPATTSAVAAIRPATTSFTTPLPTSHMKPVSRSIQGPMAPKPPSVHPVQNKISTANLVLTSASVVTSSAKSSPIVLNGAPNNTTKYANFIFVPNSMLTVPSIQGLPVIASVASAVDDTQPSSSTVARLESITASLMPASNVRGRDPVVTSFTTVVMPSVSNVTSLAPMRVATPPTVHQPAIRVKDLSELS